MTIKSICKQLNITQGLVVSLIAKAKKCNCIASNQKEK